MGSYVDPKMIKRSVDKSPQILKVETITLKIGLGFLDNIANHCQSWIKIRENLLYLVFLIQNNKLLIRINLH